jgi:hypothetical protein
MAVREWLRMQVPNYYCDEILKLCQCGIRVPEHLGMCTEIVTICWKNNELTQL